MAATANVFHLGIPEYNVHRTAHSHQDRNAASSSGVKPSQSGHCTKSSFATVAPGMISINFRHDLHRAPCISLQSEVVGQAAIWSRAQVTEITSGIAR